MTILNDFQEASVSRGFSHHHVGGIKGCPDRLSLSQLSAKGVISRHDLSSSCQVMSPDVTQCQVYVSSTAAKRHIFF